MKLFYALSVVFVLLLLLGDARALPAPFLKLFGGYDYTSQRRPRTYGHYGGSEGGNRRYKAICRIHAVDSLAFPGRVGNPVCPY
ncbi:hypothetical protein BDFB_000751 [Asbolus verrucosus]|uniref:Uncharacterized protein n=1 Tax=Asbolus verrucosus TaxID=1661398 RepID=A0A482VLK5_ASBVE|nr:hypothetical protein BDFB_000751 [Asbolus verrucosus]